MSVVLPGPQLSVRRYRKYGSLDIDLWRLDYDLSEIGQQLAWHALQAAAMECIERGGKKRILWSAGAVYLFIVGILIDQLDPLAADLLFLIETYAEPTKRWWVGP